MLPTITHIHMSVIPILAGQGTVFLDAQAHKTIYDGCMYAAGLGATVHRFRADDPEHLDDAARGGAGRRRPAGLHGRRQQHDRQHRPDLPASPGSAREHDALLYVDDAHGFGVHRRAQPGRDLARTAPGQRIVRHLGETYDNIVLVGGFSKAYSSLLAFLALPTWLKNHLKVAAPPYLYSGPVADRVAGHRPRRPRRQRRAR